MAIAVTLLSPDSVKAHLTRMLSLRRAHRGCARDRGAEQDADAHDARTGAQSGRGAPAPSAAAVREQLERIVASPAFETSERNRRFLRFVVEETLAGRADRLKGYCIATAVFDRDEMFDSQLDPIVRIEAGRLRRSLQHYYLSAGKDDPVRIAVPKGSYVPTFEHGTEARSPALALPSIDPRAESRSEIGPRLAAWRWRSLAGAVAALVGLGVSALLVTIGLHGHWSTTSPSTVPRGPAVLVLPFELSGTTAGIHLDLRRELTREVVADLTRFTEISVYAADSSATPDDTRRRMRELGIDYGVTGGVALVPNRLHVTASLVDARTGRQLWSIIVDTDLTDGDVSRLQADIASRIARELAEPYGAIFNEKAKEIAIKPPHALSSYECVLRYDLFWRRLDLQQLALARECLERAAKAAPADANTQAALALAVLDTVRFGGAKTPPAERAT